MWGISDHPKMRGYSDRSQLGKAELPIIRTPEVLYAHELVRDGSGRKIRMMLFADGVVVSCAFDTKGELPCCYTSAPGQKEAYFAFQALLADKGYKVMPLEIDNAAKGIVEKVTASADVW